MNNDKISFDFESYWKLYGIKTNPPALGLSLKENVEKAVNAVIKHYEAAGIQNPHKAIAACSEVDQYLSDNRLNTIACCSILHKKIKEAIK